MNYGELSGFTHEELSHLRYCELQLEKFQLLAESEKGNCQLPENVQQKLIALCDKLPEDSKPTFNVKTLADVSVFLHHTLESVELVKPYLETFIEQIQDLLDALFEAFT